MSEFSGVTEPMLFIVLRSGHVGCDTSFFYLKRARTHTHTPANGDVSWWSLPVRESMECMVRPAVSGDEAQRTPEHTDDQPHLTAADETLTAQTARATRAITIKMDNHQHSQTNRSLFYLMLSLTHFISTSIASSLSFASLSGFLLSIYCFHFL